MTSYLIPTNAISKDMPGNFINLKEYIPTLNIDLRYFTADNFIGRRIDGYNSPKALLTFEAGSALKKIQSELAIFGLGLKIYDAYRPQQAVDHFIRWAKDSHDIKMKSHYYPEIEKKDLFKKDYLAEKSSHSRGSAVDATLISLNGEHEELDMGTSWDFFGNSSEPNNFTVTAQQRANRMLLCYIMQKYGFQPHKKEWWHFTLENEPYPNKYFDIPIQ
tara:strand:- start:11252 stop:11905 length:654 start_codon:yes stop_codon:yes gene_type:complete